MTKLWLPPGVTRELREQTESFNHAVRAAARDYDPSDPILREFTPRLRAIDPRLLMIRAHDTIPAGLPMKPGYYHVIRDNSEAGAPDTVMIVEGEHGEYVEPTSRVFDKLAAGDMTDRRNLERFHAHQRHERQRNERDQQLEREQRREHLKELVNAYTRTSVPGTGQRWTQNQAGRRDIGERK